MDETPTWETIDYALKTIFSRHPNCNFKGVGQTQRLEYKEMENILYNLFLIIDPTCCRQLFRVIFPARNQDDRNKFMDQASAFINKRHLCADKVSSSRLRMCGGEPFRRLLSSIIKRATDVEIAADAKRLGHDKPIYVEETIDGCFAVAKASKIQLKQMISQLDDKSDLCDRLYDSLELKKQASKDLWEDLISSNSGKRSDSGDINIKTIYKSLLSRLQASNEKSILVIDRIKSKQLPETIEESRDKLTASKPEQAKRVSYFVREVRKCLTLSPEIDGKEGSKPNSESDLEKKLSDYDAGICNLISEWEKEKIKSDEEMLERPEFLERYSFYQKLIPSLDIEPLASLNSKFNKLSSPKFSELREILSEYPSPEYDDKIILEAIEKYFSN